MRPLNSSSASLRLGLLTALLFGSVAAFAQITEPTPTAGVEEDELIGRVIEVDEQADTLTVRPSEVGDNLNIPVDSPQTFEIDEGTIIRDDVMVTQLDGLENIEENDIVRLDFEMREGDRMVARNISRNGNGGSGQNQQLAQADQAQQDVQRPQELPATASFLPLLALIGIGSCLAAFGLRVRRGRR